MHMTIQTGSLLGVEGRSTEIQVELLDQFPRIQFVGLPESASRETGERVRSAIEASGLPFPRKRILVTLAPTDQAHHGTHYDLPIALAVLAAATGYEGPLSWAAGELALNGSARPVRGILPMVALADQLGFSPVVIPVENMREALVGCRRVFPVLTLAEAWDACRGAPPFYPILPPPSPIPEGPCLSEIVGHEAPKRALEIAAAGGHGLLLQGPPGGGKTQLARRLLGLLPDLTPSERVEVAAIQSSAGLNREFRLPTRPPLRAPHYTCSAIALLGGGRSLGPGEVTLAHRGVLLLDELPEFPRSTLDPLRQPLKDGFVVVAQTGKTVAFPASFLLVATSNPCPCGLYGSEDSQCRCTTVERARYRQRVGFLDKHLPMQVKVQPPLALRLKQHEETSAGVRERVVAAREQQLRRQGCLNEYDPRRTPAARVARTIADLAGASLVASQHLDEAIQLTGGHP